MRIAVASVPFWESLGFSTTEWRKSLDGSHALCHLEYAQTLATHLEANPAVTVYDRTDPNFQALLNSPEWEANGTNGTPDTYGLLTALNAFETTINSKVTEFIDNSLAVNNLAVFQKYPADIDDSERIQRAMDFCSAQNLPFILKGGTYLVHDLKLPVGLKVYGNGAIFKKPNLSVPPYNFTVEQMKWERLAECIYTTGDTTDSELTVIDGITFDGSCWGMWETPSYAQEQASLLFASATGTKIGKLKLKINNCHFINNVSDGVHIVTNTEVEFSNISSSDCFRAGLTFTGGNSHVTINNYISQSSRTDMNDGIDIEVDSNGYGGTKAINMVINNAVIDRKFDLSLAPNSTLVATNVIMRKDFYYLYCNSASLTINNSTLIQDTLDGKVILVGTGKIQFNNVNFQSNTPASGTGLQIQFYTALDNSKIELNNCSFSKCATGIAGGSGNKSRIILNNCYFAEDVNLAIGGAEGSVAFAPKELHINNCIFNNYGYWLQTVPSYNPFTQVYVSGNKILNPLNTGLRIQWSTVHYLGENLFEYGTAITTTSGYQYFGTGKRTILVDDSVHRSTTQKGYPGDTAYLRDRTRKWIYSHYNNVAGNYWNAWNEVPSDRILNAGSGTTANRPLNVHVGYSFFDTTLGKPIHCKTAGNHKVDTLTVTSGSTIAGDITLTLNAVATTITVTAGLSDIQVADLIRAKVISGWLVGGTSGTNAVKLSSTNSGVLADTTFVDTGTTGVTATIGVTTAGSANVWVDATGATV